VLAESEVRPFSLSAIAQLYGNPPFNQATDNRTRSLHTISYLHRPQRLRSFHSHLTFDPPHYSHSGRDCGKPSDFFLGLKTISFTTECDRIIQDLLISGNSTTGSCTSNQLSCQLVPSNRAECDPLVMAILHIARNGSKAGIGGPSVSQSHVHNNRPGSMQTVNRMDTLSTRETLLSM